MISVGKRDLPEVCSFVLHRRKEYRYSFSVKLNYCRHK